MSMDFPPYFADAEASFSEAKYIIFSVPFGKSSSFRKGAHLAPEKIREASWNFESFDLLTGLNLQDMPIHDYGNLDLGGNKNNDWWDVVEGFEKRIVSAGKFPIAMGGEHAITPPLLKAFAKDVCVLSLDAHLDFRNSYLDDPKNHACVMKRISNDLPADSLAVVGFRSAEAKEFVDAKEAGLHMISAFDVKKKGISDAMSRLKSVFSNRPIYLTLDIDVFDPAYAPATSTPEPFGLNPFEVYELISSFAPQLVGFDVVEVCPPYDHGQTALLAAKIIRKTISLIEKSKGL